MPGGLGSAQTLPTFMATVGWVGIELYPGSITTSTPQAFLVVFLTAQTGRPGSGRATTGAEHCIEAYPPGSGALSNHGGIRHLFAIAIPFYLATAADASGSTAPPLHRRSCSRPPRHHPDQAAPATSTCCDRPKVVVSHLHSNQRHLTAQTECETEPKSTQSPSSVSTGKSSPALNLNGHWSLYGKDGYEQGECGD